VNRFQQFYEDHETACNVALSVAGIFAVIVVSSRFKHRGGKDNKPLGVDLWQRDDGGGSMITVHMKDGLIHQFFRNVEGINA
jgi:hypothetical protein